jgi:K+/H+ antiporter YhaU regulatory subunit KhtT
MEEIEIGPTSPWQHRSVGDVEKDAAGRLLAVAILRKEGGTDMNPDPSATLLPGDALVVMKRGGRG